MRILGLVLLITASCTTSGTQAPEVIFYYQIEIINSNAIADSVKRELERIFPQKKYAITHSSGYQEPFFEEFDLNTAVPQDSLMAPHTFIHRMEKWDSSHVSTGSRLLLIHLFPEKTPSYSMEIYKNEDGEWTFLAQTGIHKIIPQKKGEKNITQEFYTSIVRYSFK